MRDEVEPANKWAFDKEVAEVFDDMLRRSIPQYELMRESVYRLGKRYIQRSSKVLDLGCSTGDNLSRFVIDSDLKVENVFYMGFDVSEPMLDEAAERFKRDKNVAIHEFDLRNFAGFTLPNVSLVMSVLTLQFTPIEYRKAIVQRVHDLLSPGGAFILVEKVLGESAQLDKDFVELYYEGKRFQGYSDEQIERKRLSLEGVLVPLSASWNEEILRDAGFRQVDCFWRYLNFAGWIGVK